MKNDGLGAGRRSRKPRPVQCFERFGKTGGLENIVFYKFMWIMVVSVPAFLRRVRHHIGVIRIVRRAVGTLVPWRAKR